MPFFLFVFLFIGLPAMFLVIGSFAIEETGGYGLDNYTALADRYFIAAFENSIYLSFVTAVIGAIFGFLARRCDGPGRPAPVPALRDLDVLRGGQQLCRDPAGPGLRVHPWPTRPGHEAHRRPDRLRIQSTGFSLYSMTGLIIVYLFFQFPLMLLVIAPSIEGLRREWQEAAENLGATPRQYWRRVAFPILTPSILGAAILLFGNAFGAQATAYQLSGGTIPLITLVISSQMQGDVLFNPGLGYAAAMGMVIVMAIVITGYSLLQRRSERWLRS